METYRYYVVYHRGGAFHSQCVTLKNPLDDEREILKLTAELSESPYNQAVILNWKRID